MLNSSHKVFSTILSRSFTSLRRFDKNELKSAVQSIPTWSIPADRECIKRTFEFKDFSSAFAFMTRIALHAEKKDHHPTWKNTYNKVEILLETHDVAGISQNDIDFAKEIDKIYGF
jgi:4a-hydroxytetrahydrobiopterin dehydratase